MKRFFEQFTLTEIGLAINSGNVCPSDSAIDHRNPDGLVVKSEFIDLTSDAANEIIEVKDDILANGFTTNNYGNDDSEQTDASNVPAFYQLEVMDDNIEDGNVKKLEPPPGLLKISDALLQNYKCKECNFLFSSEGQLREHYQFHSKVQCVVCMKNMKSPIFYQRHMNLHLGRSPFNCEMCNLKYDFGSKFQYHMQLHTDQRPFQCDKCGKHFRCKQSLRNHMLVHNDVRKYKCEICDKQFKENSSLRTHQYTHNTEKLFECDVCQLRFRTPQKVRNHKKVVHSISITYRLFVCSQCGKEFKRKDYMINHLKTHSTPTTDAM